MLLNRVYISITNERCPIGQPPSCFCHLFVPRCKVQIPGEEPKSPFVAPAQYFTHRNVIKKDSIILIQFSMKKSTTIRKTPKSSPAKRAVKARQPGDTLAKAIERKLTQIKQENGRTEPAYVQLSLFRFLY